MDPIDLGLLFIQRLLRIHTERISALQPQMKQFTSQYLFSPMVKKQDYISRIIADIKDRDIYHVTDPLGVRLTMIRIADELCVLGPYVTETLPTSELKKRFNDISLDEKHLSAFQDYVLALPFLVGGHIFTASHTLMQGVVGIDSKAIVYHVDLSESSATRLQAESSGTPVSAMPHKIYENVMRADENISLYYQLETTLAEQMISLEVPNAITTLNRMCRLRYKSFTEEDIEKVRLDAAFLCAQMRQIVIRAGVLPTPAEIGARFFLRQIRKATSLSALDMARRDMLSQFCDLIRKERTASLSPKIRQVIQLIMADLSGNLDVTTLAYQVGLSPNYLSTCFKKETGQTFSSYVHDKRLESAAHFLSFTNMPIRDIAVCVGITDFSYFTRVFREKYGETPSAYRYHK